MQLTPYSLYRDRVREVSIQLSGYLTGGALGVFIDYLEKRLSVLFSEL